MLRRSCTSCSQLESQNHRNRRTWSDGPLKCEFESHLPLCLAGWGQAQWKHTSPSITLFLDSTRFPRTSGSNSTLLAKLLWARTGRPIFLPSAQLYSNLPQFSHNYPNCSIYWAAVSTACLCAWTFEWRCFWSNQWRLRSESFKPYSHNCSCRESISKSVSATIFFQALSQPTNERVAELLALGLHFHFHPHNLMNFVTVARWLQL